MPDADSDGRKLAARKRSERLEVRLLLACCRKKLDLSDRDQIVSVPARDLDWGLIIRLGHRHGLLPLLYRHLSELALPSMPLDAFAEIWGHYERVARRNKAMTNELVEILKLFESHGISAVPYKGPALADQIYGDSALREYADLDLLVSREDLAKARSLLQERGYVPRFAIPPAFDEALLASSRFYDLEFTHPVRSILVELHWKTDAYFPVESYPGNLLPVFIETRFNGRSIRSFSPEALLIVLCVHGTKHAWDRLSWLVDVAELIRSNPAMDWQKVLEQAQAMGCARHLGVALSLASDLLDIPLPQQVIRYNSEEKVVREVARRIILSMFEPDMAERSALEFLRYHICLYQRAGKKWTFLLDFLFSPTPMEWARWPLPRQFHFLYFPLRVWRLLQKYVLRPTAPRP